MKLKNKILLTLVFSLLILCFCNINNVFAGETITFTDRNNISHTIPNFYTDDYDYSKGYILAYFDNTYSLYLFPSTCNIFGSYNNIYNYYTQSGNIGVDGYRFVLSNNVWVYDSVVPAYYNSFLSYTQVIYHSFDIYDRDNTSVIYNGSPDFFQRPVALVQSAENLPVTILETMKVLIPVGLIMLGIGLVILVIKSVIRRSL